jgi:hypothetical protein
VSDVDFLAGSIETRLGSIADFFAEIADGLSDDLGLVVEVRALLNASRGETPRTTGLYT